MSVDIKHCNLLFLAARAGLPFCFPQSASSRLLEASSGLALATPITPEQVGSQALRLAKGFYEHRVHGLLLSGWIFICLYSLCNSKCYNTAKMILCPRLVLEDMGKGFALSLS